MTNVERMWWKIFSTVLSAVLVTIVTYLISKYTGDDFGGLTGSVGGGHADTIRKLVTRPSGEYLSYIGGHDAIKRDLQRSVLAPLKHPNVFFTGSPAVRPPTGVLFHGPPGTGKTMLARALASESGVPFLALNNAVLESKWWGESPKLLASAFKVAKEELAPCIMFFDEIDGMGRTRCEQDQSCVYSFKCELLRNIDSVQNEPVMIVACTNTVQSLDPALRRRFPKTIEVGRPDLSQRLAILKVLSQEETFLDITMLDSVAAASEQRSGADLKSLFAEASNIRMEGLSVDLSTLKSGDDLLNLLGPLTWEHWVQAFQNLGFPLTHPPAKPVPQQPVPAPPPQPPPQPPPPHGS